LSKAGVPDFIEGVDDPMFNRKSSPSVPAPMQETRYLPNKKGAAGLCNSLLFFKTVNPETQSITRSYGLVTPVF
jgi:hypothetical protein